MALSREDQLFGRIAVHNKIVSEDQFEECLREKEAEGLDVDVGEIALQKGYITEKQLRAVNKAREKHMAKKAKTQVAVMEKPSSGGGKLELADEPGVDAARSANEGIAVKAPKPKPKAKARTKRKR